MKTNLKNAFISLFKCFLYSAFIWARNLHSSYNQKNETVTSRVQVISNEYLKELW